MCSVCQSLSVSLPYSLLPPSSLLPSALPLPPSLLPYHSSPLQANAIMADIEEEYRDLVNRTMPVSDQNAMTQIIKEEYSYDDIFSFCSGETVGGNYISYVY